jgi:hypothetical protein
MVPVAQGISDTFFRKDSSLGAKQKLNEAHIAGACLLGGLAGLALQSWFVFIAVTALLLGAAVRRRDIR